MKRLSWALAMIVVLSVAAWAQDAKDADKKDGDKKESKVVTTA